MKFSLKKSALFFAAIMLLSLFLSACRATHSSCPAYGGEAKKYKIERAY